MNTYGLIGEKLSHSFSKKYFEQKFTSESITDCEYKLYETSDLKDLITELRSETSLKGLNVTIPYKREIIPFLDELSESAVAIGAVNCIQIIDRDGSSIWKGYNTDFMGFENSISDEWWNRIESAYILGSGGASDAIRYVLQNRRIPFKIVSRAPRDNKIGYSEIDYSPDVPALFINATPLGTYPNIDSAPQIQYERLSDSHFLYDLTYNPKNTLFMQLGRKRGCMVKNGYDMLKIQAEESWKIWTRSNN
jgi:shikimate dehydrogenase